MTMVGRVPGRRVELTARPLSAAKKFYIEALAPALAGVGTSLAVINRTGKEHALFASLQRYWTLGHGVCISFRQSDPRSSLVYHPVLRLLPDEARSASPCLIALGWS
jgi:hypothetical protein